MNEIDENLEEENNKEDSEENLVEIVSNQDRGKKDNTEIIEDSEHISEKTMIDTELQNFDSESLDISDSHETEGLNEENFSIEVEESEEEEAARLARQIRDFHKNQIEAALYASGKPLDIEMISNKLEIGKKETEELINELAFDYLDRSTALVIAQIGDRYQMQIKPEFTEKASKFAEGGAIAEKYLRTLTVIALKQPILKSLIIKLRGTGAYEHIKYLLENDFINAVKKGRSQELTTTDKYAEMFGLPKNIEEMKRIMIAQLGLEEGAVVEKSSELQEEGSGEDVMDTEEISSSEDSTEIENEFNGNEIIEPKEE